MRRPTRDSTPRSTAEQGADNFGQVPNLQAGARDRPLKMVLKRNVLQAYTRSASDFVRPGSAAGKDRREMFGAYTPRPCR
jgi:hypothetical protein